MIKRKKIQHEKRQSGLSIIEMLVTISIFVIVMGAIVSSVIIFYRSNGFAVEQAFAVNSARMGVEQMVRDIREATLSDVGDYPIIEMSTSTLLFYSDIDRDDSVELVRFFLEDDSFKKGVTNSSGIPPVYAMSTDEGVSAISDNVRNVEEDTAIFRYFDSDGVEVIDFNNIADVSFVQVNLIVNVNPTRLPNEFSVRSSATLRNLKINL